jgi:hypothetical protein
MRYNYLDKITHTCKNGCKEIYDNTSSVGASLYEFPLKQSMLGKRNNHAPDEEEIKT